MTGSKRDTDWSCMLVPLFMNQYKEMILVMQYQSRCKRYEGGENSMKTIKSIRKFAVLLLCSVTLLSMTAAALYYNTYTTVATIPNGNSCNRTQGFAVGSDYSYTAKCNDDESVQVIYRTKLSDGSTTLMTNADNASTYTTHLGHANDMDTCTIDESYHLFVATMKTGSESLVKLQYSGTTYTQLGGFDLRYNDSDLAISGVKKYAKDANYIYFLFFGYEGADNDVTVYRGMVPLTANSGTINVSYAFQINIADALVNGQTVSGLNDFSRQGIGYIASSDQLLVPLTKQNVSIILAYNNASTATGTVTADPNLSFRITSTTYPSLFEIEGCDETNGKLYFNCNRKANSSDILHDAVCYFNGFTIGS